MSGPPPKHPNLRLLEGDRSKGKSQRRRMPEATRADECPAPPDALNEHAREEWRAVAPELHRLGLLTILDVAALAAYCSARARQRQAEEAIERLDTLTVTGANGMQRAHPLVRIASTAAADALRIGAHFGLSPISRLRLSGMEPPGPAGKFDGLLA
jgi:P27 family predicted phage terminase small subunit